MAAARAALSSELALSTTRMSMPRAGAACSSERRQRSIIAPDSNVTTTATIPAFGALTRGRPASPADRDVDGRDLHPHHEDVAQVLPRRDVGTLGHPHLVA